MPNTLTRWDPMSEFANMRSVVDRLFGESFNRLPFRGPGEELGTMPLNLDVYETNDSFVIKAAVPGIDPKDVDIQVEDDVLTIKGEYRHESQVNEDQYLRREMRYGSFQRSLRLPPTVEAERAQCSFENGVLKLELPKKPEARSKSIKITPQGVLEGEHQASQN
jgi:HSP20 family protein